MRATLLVGALDKLHVSAASWSVISIYLMIRFPIIRDVIEATRQVQSFSPLACIIVCVCSHK